MKESKVEKHLREQVIARGGLCVKLNPQGYVGIPDRLVIMPGGAVRAVELKRPRGGRVSPLQENWRVRLEALGLPYSLLRSVDEVNELMSLYDRAG